jgi:hypothetical protein
MAPYGNIRMVMGMVYALGFTTVSMESMDLH